MRKFGVVMAGGSGTRFWPLSRQNNPKQFLNFSGKDVLINETMDRLAKVISLENQYVVTGAEQAELLLEVTAGRLQKEHVFTEPEARNTAACVGYAAAQLYAMHGDCVLCLVPSDHYVGREDLYAEVLEEAVSRAENSDELIIIGSRPTYPATGYGYIRMGERLGRDMYRVDSFVEKPDFATARGYLVDGHYLWNSGIFVWKASAILAQYQKYLPQMYEALQEIVQASEQEREAVKERLYPALTSISVDCGILERSDRILVLEGNFAWNDVGTWDALEQLYERDEYGNIAVGETLYVDSRDCMSYSTGRLIATVGLDGVGVVETRDAILVFDKKKAQKVKMVTEELSKHSMERYLRY